MKKITEITEEQKAKCPEYVDKWTAIGKSTKKMNKKRAEKAINLVYECSDLKTAPKRIVWSESPTMSARIYSIIMKYKPDTLEGFDALDFNEEIDPIGLNELKNITVLGSHEAGWLSFYDYFRVEFDLKEETENLTGLSMAAQECGWFTPMKDVCIVSERHNILHLDNDGRLHCLEGQAQGFPDGTGKWCIHGIDVGKRIVEQPETITVKEIEKESNVELRRILIDQYGQDRYLIDSGAKEINTDDWGTLYRKIQDDDEDMLMVKLVNSTVESDGTYKEYFFRVPPDENITTAYAAVCWGYGDPNYNPQQQT